MAADDGDILSSYFLLRDDITFAFLFRFIETDLLDGHYIYFLRWGLGGS